MAQRPREGQSATDGLTSVAAEMAGGALVDGGGEGDGRGDDVQAAGEMAQGPSGKSMIKAIETQYRGCWFRSRLEARWAVFFDALGIRWEYEKEGFEITSLWEERRWRYLPDFYLTDLKTWVEVKGSLDDVSDDYLYMIASACDWNCCLPGLNDSCGTTRGLLWLGPVPKVDDELTPRHVLIQHCKGGIVMEASFIPTMLYSQHETEPVGKISYCLPGRIQVGNDLADFDACGEESGPKMREILSRYVYSSEHGQWQSVSRLTTDAYHAALSARFEHGEKGPPR